MLDYWGFYPTGDPTWGRVPAMGWAEVVESTHPGVEVGSRYYGWFPMAEYVDLTVGVTATGLRDDGAHRAAHAPGVPDRRAHRPRCAPPVAVRHAARRSRRRRGPPCARSWVVPHRLSRRWVPRCERMVRRQPRGRALGVVEDGDRFRRLRLPPRRAHRRRGHVSWERRSRASHSGSTTRSSPTTMLRPAFPTTWPASSSSTWPATVPPSTGSTTCSAIASPTRWVWAAPTTTPRPPRRRQDPRRRCSSPRPRWPTWAARASMSRRSRRGWAMRSTISSIGPATG